MHALDERLGGLAVVVGLPGADVVGRLHVEALAQLAVHGAVEVLLHVAVRHPGAGGEPAGTLGHVVDERRLRVHRVDDAQQFGVLGTQLVGEVVQLQRLAAADETGQEPGAAVVTGEADLGERRGQYGPGRGVAQIARQGEGRPRPPAAPGSAAIVGLGIS